MAAASPSRSAQVEGRLGGSASATMRPARSQVEALTRRPRSGRRYTTDHTVSARPSSAEMRIQRPRPVRRRLALHRSNTQPSSTSA
ncbi:MAG: hypothetical protein DI635_15030 [Pseudoxanthomonas suwonensis]|nr:MAG: hypothetical protein DI635_15030 [Pseudoxanthomonas suwonensis]